MKSYGINWFLVWVGFLFFMWPFYLWMQDTLFFRWNPTFPASASGIGQSFCWTILFYFGYSHTLADPKKLERLRESRQKRRPFRYRRYRWLILLATIFGVVAGISLICRLFFHHPSWGHIAVYSFGLPCSCLFSLWLIDRTWQKGQLAQLLKDDGENEKRAME